jgi:hypothetical protein
MANDIPYEALRCVLFFLSNEVAKEREECARQLINDPNADGTEATLSALKEVGESLHALLGWTSEKWGPRGPVDFEALKTDPDHPAVDR